MNRVEKLVSELCPSGVPVYSLGSLLVANRGGGTPSTAKLEYWNGDIPWTSIGDMNTSGMFIGTTRRWITEAGLNSSSSSLVKAGDVLVAVKISPGAMKIASRDIAINQDIRGLTLDSRVNPTFLVYFFRTFSIVGDGTIVKGITNATLEKVRVPLPPLEVQNEIARILDTFTALEVELEAELEARKLQYEVVRDRLLLFQDLGPGDAAVYPLGEIGTILSGLRGKSKDDFTDGNAPYVSYVEIFKNPGIEFVPERRVKVASSENQNAVQLGDLLVTGSSETRNECGMTAVVTTEPVLPVYVNSFCFIWRPNKNFDLDPQFAKHLFRGRAFRDRVIETANGVTRQNISKPKFLAIEILLPRIEHQREVASILNSFTKVMKELEDELGARKAQNEHYRRKLLVFKEFGVE